jgi:hypothetical protein
MSKISYIAIITVITSLTAFTFAQSEAEVEYWKANIAGFSVNDINERLADPSNPRWPVIISPHASEQLAEKEKQTALQSIQIGEALLEKMAAAFKSDSDPQSPEVESEVALYTSLASGLRRSGGYGNLLLADSANRLAIYRVSGWVVFHPDQTSESTRLLEMLSVPVVDATELLGQLRDQGVESAKSPAIIEKVRQGKNLFEAFDLANANFNLIFDPSAQSAARLLKESSVIGVITRMAITESLVRVNISGAIRFFQKGGTYAELNSKDIRPFESRMGADARHYNYRLLQMKKLRVSDVMYLIGIHKDPAARSAFIKMVLR